MTPEEAKKLPKKLKPNPLKNLPNHLKDPANYEKICKALYDAGGSTCDHSEVIEWAGCIKCQSRQKDRAEMMRKLGFPNGQIYLLWRKTHEQIRSLKRNHLEKYNT